MDYAIAAAAVIGLVNGFRLLKNWQTDKWGFIFFCLALAAGLVFGYLKWFGLPGIEAGFVVGLTSSGFYRVAQVV